MPGQTEASALTTTFSFKPKTIGCTKYGWKAAMPHQIRIAFHEWTLAVARAVRVGCLSRHQSRDGLAFCGGARDAGKEATRGVARLAADCVGPRALNRRRCPPRRA